MVNIDEINESISKFGAVVDGLSKLEDTYAKVDETNASAKKAVEEAQETLVKQTALNSEITSKMGEMEFYIDTINNLPARIETSETFKERAARIFYDFIIFFHFFNNSCIMGYHYNCCSSFIYFF